MHSNLKILNNQKVIFKFAYIYARFVGMCAHAEYLMKSDIHFKGSKMLIMNWEIYRSITPKASN